MLLAMIAALAAVLVPHHAERLIDTPLTWAADLSCGLRRQRPLRAGFEIMRGS